MTPLLAVLLASEAFAVLGLLAMLTRVALRHRRDRTFSLPAADVRVALLDDLIAGTDNGTDALSALPLRWRTKVLTELAMSVGATERAVLRKIAERCGVATQARARIRSRRSARRVAGLQTMTPLELRDPVGLTLLADPEPPVRAAAVWWCAVAYRDPEAATRVAACADDADAHVRHVVAESLIACGTAGIPAVVALLTGGSPTARHTALLAAVGLHDPAITAAALARLADPDPALRIAGIRAVGGTASPATHPALAALLADPDPSVRTAAAHAIAQGRTPADALRIAPLLHDSDAGARIAAGRALVALGPVGELAVRTHARAARTTSTRADVA